MKGIASPPPPDHLSSDGNLSYTSVSCAQISSELPPLFVCLVDTLQCRRLLRRVFWRWRPHATGHHSILMLCSFTNQVLARHVFVQVLEGHQGQQG